MSEEIPQTADSAIRSWIGAVAFTFVLVGGELMIEKDGIRFFTGLGLAVAGLPLYLSVALWKTIKPHLNNRFLRTLNDVATDARWWTGAIFVVLLGFIITPALPDYWIGYFSTGIILLVIVIGAGSFVWAMRQNHTNPNAAFLDRIGKIDQEIEQNNAALLRLEMRTKSDFSQLANNYEFLSRALYARDAETIIKEEDKNVRSIGRNLIEGFYTDEAAWANAYKSWEKSIRRIDSLLSDWLGDKHSPFFNDHLKDIHQNTPLPPKELTSYENQTHFRIVYMAQSSYSNRRDNIFIYFSSKTQLPRV